MDKKLEELLNAIKFPEENYSSFFNVSLKRVKVNKNNIYAPYQQKKVNNLPKQNQNHFYKPMNKPISILFFMKSLSQYHGLYNYLIPNGK